MSRKVEKWRDGDVMAGSCISQPKEMSIHSVTCSFSMSVIDRERIKIRDGGDCLRASTQVKRPNRFRFFTIPNGDHYQTQLEKHTHTVHHAYCLNDGHLINKHQILFGFCVWINAEKW